MKPRVVTALTDRDGGVRTIGPESVRRVLPSGAAASIVEAMTEAVEGDLGRLYTRGAKVPGVLTAGKSGTAQLSGSEPHSWFIGFAPADDPQIAIAVLVERGGRGGERAAPMAGDLMQAYFEGVGG
jgi:peptidoglycan glycosyltransferase